MALIPIEANLSRRMEHEVVSKAAVTSRKIIVVDSSLALSGNCFQGSERGMVNLNPSEMILNVGNKTRGKGGMNYVIKPESEGEL